MFVLQHRPKLLSCRKCCSHCFRYSLISKSLHLVSPSMFFRMCVWSASAFVIILSRCGFPVNKFRDPSPSSFVVLLNSTMVKSDELIVSTSYSVHLVMNAFAHYIEIFFPCYAVIYITLYLVSITVEQT